MTSAFASVSGLAILVPLLAALALAFLRRPVVAGWISVAASAMAFALVCGRLIGVADADGLLLGDRLATHMAMLSALAGLVTAWCGRTTAIAGAHGALFQATLGCVLLAALVDNVFVTWVAIEGAVLAILLGGGAAMTAGGWRRLMVGVAGLGIALFGSVLLYLAGQQGIAAGPALTGWTMLNAATLPPAAALGFLFVVAGYGICAAIALTPRLGERQPTALLAPAVAGVALVAILRAQSSIAWPPAALHPGIPLMALALLGVLLTAFSLARESRAGNFITLVGAFHVAIAAFAFGLGARAGGLLHLSAAVLVLPVLGHALARAGHIKGGSGLDTIGGLVTSHRALGLTLVAALVAMAVLPPFGLFASVLAILGEAARSQPWLVLPLGLGLLVGAGSIAARLVELCLGPAMPDHASAPSPGGLLASEWVPAWLLLGLAVALGFAAPAQTWFATIAATLR